MTVAAEVAALLARDAPAGRRALDAALRALHGSGRAGDLAALHALAAGGAAEDEAAFHLTHALVYALEAGDPMARTYRAQLVAMGRESA